MMMVVVAALLLQGCATTPEAARDLQGMALPPVAAAFRTTARHEGRTLSGEWRYWRDAHRVVRQDLDAQTGEVWQRDGTTMFHTLLFHADRRGIEFEPADLQMTGDGASWDQQARIVDPRVLARLRPARAGNSGGAPYQEYVGTLQDVKWRVRIHLGFGIPLLVEQQRGRDVVRVELVAAHALAQAPWSPPDTQSYGMLDFADLGDHERDPFVLRLQAGMGTDHAHAH